MSCLLSLLGLHFGACLVFVIASETARMVVAGTPFEFSPSNLSRLAREWVFAAALVPVWFAGLGRAPPRQSRDSHGERTPVLLIPGYGLNRAHMGLLAMHLRRHGWPWVHAINNEPWSTPIPVFARNLAQEVDALRQASGATQVDLVGHSMGGLIAAWYINHMGGAPHVRQLITLGTPWRGTLTHVLLRRRQARDCAPESELLQKLGPPAVPTTAVWSPHDALILPTENNITEGVQGLELPQLGHIDMLASARVFASVANLLMEEAKP
jgi:hypothetical protein